MPTQLIGALNGAGLEGFHFPVAAPGDYGAGTGRWTKLAKQRVSRAQNGGPGDHDRLGSPGSNATNVFGSRARPVFGGSNGTARIP